MVSSVNSTAVQIPAVIRESDGALMVWTSGGYKTLDEAKVSLSASTSVTVDSLFAGEDEKNNLQRVLPIGTEFKCIKPMATPAGPMPNAAVFGMTGGENDFLRRFTPTIRDPARAAVYLEHGSAADVISGVTGTVPNATTLTSSVSVVPGVPVIDAIPANGLQDCILYMDYRPKNATTNVSAGKSVRFRARITDHPAIAAGTTAAISFNVSGEMMAGDTGATVVGWGVRPEDSAWELCAPNQSGQAFEVYAQALDPAGFKLAVGSGVQIWASGEATW